MLNAGRPASFPPYPARPRAFPARFAFLCALAAALAGCSSDSRRLLAEDGSRRAPGAEARYPDVFQPKPKEPPPTFSKSEERAVRAQLQKAADTHRSAVESQIAPLESQSGNSR